MTCDTIEPLMTHMSELVQFYMLPELKEDLDSQPLMPSQFESHQELLQQELPKLYDLVQEFLSKNESSQHNARQQELRAQLVLLLCEVTAEPTVFQLKASAPQSLLRNAHELLKKLTTTGSLDGIILKYYEEKLHKDKWKRQLGAVHGFVRYLQLRYVELETKMSTQMLNFSLALGLNVRECHLLVYKQMGVQIFTLILNQSNPKDIQDLNIHSVIYQHVLPDAYNREDSVEFTAALWNCLCLCLDHFMELDAFQWNQCDDMLERLVQNVTMSSQAQNSICLLEFITKLGYHFTINQREIQAALSLDLTQTENMSSCREVCASINACTSYRWAKQILEMFVLESDKLLQSVDICLKMLGQLQRCFMVCILPIPLQALHHHLGEFYTKFVAVLMECLVVHERAQPLVQLVLQFLELFLFQLANCSPQAIPSDLMPFSEALEKLLNVIAQ